MSDDPKQPRVGWGPDKKTPLDRALEVRELQRAQDELVPAAPTAPARRRPADPVKPVSAVAVARADTAFDVAAVGAVDTLKGRTDAVHDAAVYAASQMEVGALYQAGKAGDVQVLGEVSRVINFGSGEVMFLYDAKNSASAFDLVAPANAVKVPDPPLVRLRTGNNLMEISLKPKAGGDPLPKRAVLFDDQGQLKGAEFQNRNGLEQGLKSIPLMLLNVFQSLWDAGVKDDDSARHRIDAVKPGKKSSYEVTLSRKNGITGKWDSRTALVNNYGQVVPESPKDPRRFDIVKELYYLDRYSAS